MNVQLKDLVVGQYYKCSQNYIETFFFKFEKLEDGNIFSYNFEIHMKNDEDSFLYRKLQSAFSDTTWYKLCVFIKEIELSEIVFYLPDDHIDKKYYLRNKKINTLLNVNE